ncbi:MAG: copper transporter [bacterium]
MISFRYHLVSIIAVFLALALGILVGTTGLNGAVLDGLRNERDNQAKTISQLRSDGTVRQQQLTDGEDFVQDYAASLVGGALAGQTVVIVSAPGANSGIKAGVEKMVKDAGGSVVGRLDLASGFIDPQRGPDIAHLATGDGRPAGLQLPESSDSTVLGGALLAYVLSGKGVATDIETVMAGFGRLRLIRVEKPDPKPAKLAIVIGAGTFTKDDGRAKAVPSLVGEFARAGLKTVVVGDAGTAMGAGTIAAVRGDTIMKQTVATVDNANTAMGQVSSVLALAQLVTGDVGQYGTGAGAEDPFPPTGK